MNAGYTIVGAPWDDFGAAEAGVVKVFDASGMLLHQLTNPTPALSEQFGCAVAISGTRIVVGALGDNNGAGAAYVYDLSSGTPTVPVATLTQPSPIPFAGENFGYSVAIAGTRVLVGAYQAPPSGKAYVYELTGPTPTVATHVLSNAGVAFFGRSVALSGNTAVVGSDRHAAIYDLAGATPTVPVVEMNDPVPYQDFGVSVAISGSLVAVGAPGNDSGATDVGAAYLYDLTSGTPAVPVLAITNPDPDDFDQFGLSVAIAGTRVVIGAFWEDTGGADAGAAYVYDVGGATPTVPILTLNNPTPAPVDIFGHTVAISGDRFAVAARLDDTGATDAGSVYVYSITSATPSLPIQTLNSPGVTYAPYSSSAVRISGGLLLVGSLQSGPAYGGTVCVYDLAGPTPTVPRLVINNPNPEPEDVFGEVAAISGSRVVVGAPGEATTVSNVGAAYVYDIASATPAVPIATLTNPADNGQGPPPSPGPLTNSGNPAEEDRFGQALAIEGNRVVVGSPWADLGGVEVGCVYVYDLTSPTPSVPVLTLLNPSSAAYGAFGYSVAISGTRLVVGAHLNDTGATDAGVAYVYDLSSGTPGTPMHTLVNPNPAVGDYFGLSVAISGPRVVVGAGEDDPAESNPGRAYVYDLGSPTPTTPTITLNDPAAIESNRFGCAVAISGSRVLIGARGKDSGAPYAGGAYVFDLSGATPGVPVATLNNPTPGESDEFGTQVAIDGTTLAINSPFDDTVVEDGGYAYVFTPSNPDYDGDGLLDIWEEARFGSIAAHTAADDTDGDGRTELLEQAFDTDPLFSDLMAAPAVVDEGGFLTITLSKRAGVSYTVETAGSPEGADFSMGTTTIITNTATTLKVRDNFTPATAAQRFMRVKVEPAP